MTNTTVPDEVLKTDVLGRVHTPRARREALLEEFERSGVSGAAFAALVGVKYPTLAWWIQQRRRNGVAARLATAATVPCCLVAVEPVGPAVPLEAPTALTAATGS